MFHRRLDRRLAGCLTSLALFLSSLSCSKDRERFTAPRYMGPLIPNVDFAPAWSHDGRSIAYWRAFPSQDGPAGVYVVPSSGGRPRFVAPNSFLSSGSLGFAPDDRSLVGSSQLQLVIIDIATGSANTPTYTANGAHYPDWSPDGRQIVYNRIYYIPTFPAQPYDSAGIHIYDVSTGEDHPIFNNDQVVFGIWPRWSPDGSHIAFIEDGTPQAIKLMRSDGTDLRTLAHASPRTLLRNLTWFRLPTTGAVGVLYIESNGHTFFISPYSSNPIRFSFRYGYEDISPDGAEYAVIGALPSDSVGVVCTVRVNDLTGETLHEIAPFAGRSAVRRFVLLGGR